MKTNTIPAEKMPTFERDVRALFNARWTDGKVARWAGSAASGYGIYVTEKEALGIVTPILDAMRRERTALFADAMRELRENKAALRADFPSFAKFIR